MLVFGHVGITLAAGLVLKRAFPYKPDHADADEPVAGSSFRKIIDKMDPRILIAGSMLPDLIDKPLGQMIFKESIGNGRIYAHTLLFLVALSILGFYLYRSRHHVWLVVISFGSLLHIIEDEMWSMPRTLFWPFIGSTFDKLDSDYWLGSLWYKFLHDPSVYIPEWIGIALVAGFGIWLIYSKEVRRFLRQGRII